MKIALYLFGTTIAYSLLACNQQGHSVAASPSPQQKIVMEKPKVNEDTITIVAVGDLMLGSSYPSEKLLPPNDAKNSFKQVKQFLQGDIVFGNLEGVLLDEGEPARCKGKNPDSCFAFRMPERYGSILKDAGFNLLSLANNHLADFGVKGRKRTIRVLDSLKIYHAGQLEQSSVIFKNKGLRFGFIAFSPHQNTLDLRKLKLAQQKVAQLKQQVDIVIVSFHGGGEGNAFQHVTKKVEKFKGEHRGDVYAFAHAVIDAGADVVIGHGPHVVRAVEVYKNKFIAYSLGNFCTQGKISIQGLNGIAPLMRIKINKQGHFLYSEVISTQQFKHKELMLDTKNRAFNKIKELTNMDFPRHSLKFEQSIISTK